MSDPLEAVRMANAGTLMERLGIEWVDVSPERVVATMPVEGNMQPFGVLHGGATAVLCESVASVGTTAAAGGRRALGIELNVNHLRAVTSGAVTATATPLHLGRTTAVWDIRVTDDEGRTTAAGRCTLIVRD